MTELNLIDLCEILIQMLQIMIGMISLIFGFLVYSLIWVLFVFPPTILINLFLPEKIDYWLVLSIEQIQLLGFLCIVLNFIFQTFIKSPDSPDNLLTDDIDIPITEITTGITSGYTNNPQVEEIEVKSIINPKPKSKYYCQICNCYHKPDQLGYFCLECKRFVCSNCFEISKEKGFSLCPFCSNKLYPTNEPIEILTKERKVMAIFTPKKTENKSLYDLAIETITQQRKDGFNSIKE